MTAGADEVLMVLPLDVLKTDRRLQMRSKRDPDVISQYAEAMRHGGVVKFPPLRVVHDTESEALLIWDGNHREEAAVQAELSEFACLVRPGTIEDAIWLALSANKEHGLRRSNKDKEKAVRCALRRRPELADKSIAEHVGVDHKTVGKHRARMEANGEIPRSEVRTTTDGSNYTVTGKPRAKDAAKVTSSPPMPSPDAEAIWEIPRLEVPTDADDDGPENSSIEPDDRPPDGAPSSAPCADSRCDAATDDCRNEGPTAALSLQTDQVERPSPDKRTVAPAQVVAAPQSTVPAPTREPSHQSLAGKVRRYHNAKKDAEKDIKEALSLIHGRAAMQIPFVDVQVLLRKALERLKEIES